MKHIGFGSAICGAAMLVAAPMGAQADETLSLEEVRESTRMASKWLNLELEDYNAPEVTYTGDPIEIRLSSHLPEASERGEFLKQSFAVLEHMSDGKLVIKPRWSGAVHSVREGFDANRSGITDFAACFVFLNASNFPLTGGLALPGIFPNPEVLSLVAEELAGKYFLPEFEKQGVYIQSITASTHFNLFSTQPITTLADLKGKKVRSGTGVNKEIFEDLGAVPVNMGSGDLFSALQRGLIDAIFTSDASARTFRINEVASNHTYTPINFGTFEWCMNPRFFSSLPSDLQAVFYDWSRQKSQVETQLSFSLGSAEAKAQFLDEGMKYNRISDEEFALWQEAYAPVVDAYVKKGEAEGLPTKQLLEDMRASVEKYRGMSREELLTHVMDSPAAGVAPMSGN